MARGDIEIRRTDSIRTEFDRLHQAISQRAYELFRHRDSWSGAPLMDWLSAEHELVWQPPVELRQKDGQLELLAAVAGVEPKDLDVQVTSEDVLIKADVDHQHTAESGAVHLCEFNRGKVFRSIHLPEQIDPETVKAEYRNGMLRLTASIATPVAKKIAVPAA
jgi:HSP20 family protein